MLIMVVEGVSNKENAFRLTLNEIDKMKNLVARINDRNICHHLRTSYVIGSVDEKAGGYLRVKEQLKKLFCINQ